MGDIDRVLGTDISVHMNDGGANGSGAVNPFGSTSYTTNPQGQNPISVVNPELTINPSGDEFLSQALQELNVKPSNATNIIIDQRLNIHREVVKNSGNVQLTNDEKMEKFKPFIDLEQIRRNLALKCSEAGISFSELMVKMSALTGKTPREFNSMKPEIQELLLNFVIESIDRVTGKNIQGVNTMEAVITDCALMYEFIFSSGAEKVDIAKLTPDEIKNGRKMCDEKFKKLKAEKEAKLAQMSPAERAEAEKQIQEEFAAKRKQIFESLSKKVSFESALELLLMVSVMDLGEEAKALMESFPIEIREKIANTMHNFDSFKEYIEIAKGRGEALDDEKAQFAIQQYHKIFGTYKTAENLAEYEQQFVKARTRGELPEEVLKPTSMGIGEAAYANINMTSEEKHSFIQQWVRDNDGFLTDDDMAKVEHSAKEYIKELLSKNPELKDRFNYVKKTIKEVVENTLKREFKPKKANNTAKNDSKKSDKHSHVRHYGNLKFVSNAQLSVINTNVVDFVKVYFIQQQAKFECTAIEKSETQITTALLRGIISDDDAVRNLNNSEHKFVKLCVKNERLAAIYDDRITAYIQSEKDEDKLREIAEVAPRNIVQKIIDNMRGDKSGLAEELIKSHSVDHNTIVTLENTVLNHDVA